MLLADHLAKNLININGFDFPPILNSVEYDPKRNLLTVGRLSSPKLVDFQS